MILINQMLVINQTTPQSEWKMFVPSEVDPLIQKLSVPEVRSKLQKKNLDFTGNKLEIKKRLNQFCSDSEDNSLSLNDNMKNLLDEKLKPGFALKSNQKYGRRMVRSLI